MALILIFFSCATAFTFFFIIRHLIKKGVADEYDYPLANCDTSLVEECLPEPRRLRILHVNDQAGVAGVLSKYQQLSGHDAKVIVRRSYDVFGQQKYYNEKQIGLPYYDFSGYRPINKCLKLVHRTINVIIFYLYVACVSRKYDVVHIHSQYLVSLLLPFKPKIIEFHGTDIRSCPSNRWKIDRFITSLYLRLNRNKQFYVSTTDLLLDLPTAIYIPNPVDLELFKNQNIQNRNTALYIQNWYEQPITSQVEKIATELKVNLTIINRAKKQFTPYENIPAMLGKFEYFIDRYTIKSLSKTALEALAVGTKVIDYNNNLLTVFPDEHDPSKVAKQTIQIYMEKIKQ